MCGYRTKAPFNAPFNKERFPIPENAIRMGHTGRGGGGGEAGPGGGRGDGAVHGVLAGLALALRTPAPVIVAGPNTLQRVLYVYVHMHTQMHLHTYAHYRCAHTSVYIYICIISILHICTHTCIRALPMHTRVHVHT